MGDCVGIFLSLPTSESCFHSEGGTVSRFHSSPGHPSAHSLRLISDLVYFVRYCQHLLESCIVGGFGLGVFYWPGVSMSWCSLQYCRYLMLGRPMAWRYYSLIWDFACVASLSLQYCHYLIMNDSGSLALFLTGLVWVRLLLGRTIELDHPDLI